MSRSYLKIQSKLAFMLVATVSLSVGAVVYLAFLDKKDQIEKFYENSIKTLNDSKLQLLENQIKQVRSSANIILNRPILLKTLSEYSQLTENEINVSQTIARELDAISYGLKNTLDFDDLHIVSLKGKNLYSVSGSQIENLINNTERTTLGQIDEKGNYSISFPIKDEKYETLGFLVISLNISKLLHVSDPSFEFGVLVWDSLNYRYFTEKSTRKFSEEELKNSYLALATSNQVGFLESVNSLNYVSILKIGQWKLVSAVQKFQIRLAVWQSLSKLLTFSFIIIFSITLVATFFFRFFLRPILILQRTLRFLSQGILPNPIGEVSNDEFGDIALAVNDLIENLQKNAELSYHVGQGNFETSFQPVSQDDVLGNALVAMRESLKQAHDRDQARNWITSGVAEFGQLLRFQDDIDHLSSEIISYFCERVNAIQGSIYVFEPSSNSFKLKATYAYHRKKILQAEFAHAQGLVGQCAAEKDFIIRSEIPDNYFVISSGILNDAKPKHLVFCPLIDNEKVYAIVELAFFKPFLEVHKEFIKEVSLIAARAIYSLQVNQTTLRLLDEARKLSSELQINQEVLREQADVMKKTQQQLELSNLQLEQQFKEVKLTQKRTQLLLENASEIVVIYEVDRKIRYISPSVSKILGYDAAKMTDTYDEVNILTETRQNFIDLFEKTLSEPELTHTTQYRYLKSDSSAVWLEATAINLVQDAAIQGIVLNIRDITERLRAESEERMRSRMQALSENSPDIVARLNPAKEFFYVNPAISSIGNFSPANFVGRKLNQAPISESLKEKWDELIDNVLITKVKHEAEVQFFLKGLGEKTVIVKVIPEFDSTFSIESLLLVSHDITDIKLRETELQVSTKKIKESINYAKRIQQTIIPDNEIFEQHFKDFFILYKPRDVVSGDFPWIFAKQNKIYFGAVDCTGHGVPGALMSLIGYFALNDIVSAYQDISCGEILDLLHEKVSKAMKQDSGSPSNDGMDIALCCFDIKENILHFAGAHRPLYIVASSELLEIKGDVAPIGGSHYQRRQPYNTHTFMPKRGDSLYLMTDGITDQFGGEMDKKFGNQKIREFLKNYHHQSMTELGKIIENEHIIWKGANNQTDDILVVGIKF
jgi:PAS domain S-box-containing protein